MNLSFKFLVTAFAFLAVRADAVRPWTLEDVSVLFPLPRVLPDPNALRPLDPAAFGPLLPERYLNELPQLDVFIGRDELKDHLQVIGVRFDPPEVRIVWQPLRDVPISHTENRIESVDVAVHTFYRIPDHQVAGFTRAWHEVASIHPSSVTTPLGAHSELSRAGWASPYGRAFMHLLKSNLGEARLTKVTFMSLLGGGIQWRFGGFEVDAGRILPLTIPRIQMTASRVQVFVNNFFPQTEFVGGVGPAPDGQPALNRLLRNSRLPEVNAEPALREAYFTVKRLENPRISLTAQTDCVSCHVAQPVKVWLENKRPELVSDHLDRYRSGVFELRNLSPLKGRTDNIRGFGYFGPAVAISDRAIYESAEVAERLNRQ